MAKHPLGALEPRFLGLLTIRLGALFVFASALMMLVDVPLEGEASPFGIVSFELAGVPQQALRILLEWKSRDALGHARLSLLVDFVYLLIYGLFFACLATWVGARLNESKWSARAAWAATVAAVFDMLENAVLLYELARFTTPSPYPQVAASFALAKFGLLLFSAAYGLVGGLASSQRR